jgi:hypothetical protein
MTKIPQLHHEAHQAPVKEAQPMQQNAAHI